MANNKPNSKIKLKQNEVIENNIELIEILFFIFQSQVLDLDLKEFCLKYNIYQSEGQYNRVIKNLITNNIVKTKKLVNTSNNVIIAKAPIFNFFGFEGETTRYSIETITRNSYINYILINKMELDFNYDIQDIAKYLRKNTTLLSKKRSVQDCYKPFNARLNTQGKDAKIDALYREEQRKVSLNNIEKVELKRRVGEEYKVSVQTLRERDIYTTYIDNHYKFYITDNNSTYILSNLSEKIALLIKVLIEQVDISDMKSLDIIILVKDSYSKRRLEDNFITKYKDNEKVNLHTAINKAINKYNDNYKAEYKFISKNRNELYRLESVYQSEAPPILRLKVINTEIAHKHNSNLRALALVQHQEEKKRKRLIQELEKEGVVRKEVE